MTFAFDATLATRAVMRGNRRADTRPERRIRSALHAGGLRFRKDFRIDDAVVRVRADIAFPRARVAVFVDGCFWHSCPDHGTAPARNEEYWIPKLARNIRRDRVVDDALVSVGWKVVRLWEHVPVQDATARIVEALTGEAAREGGSAES